MSQGDTGVEALENIKDAIQLCLEVRRDDGLPLTVPASRFERRWPPSPLT